MNTFTNMLRFSKCLVVPKFPKFLTFISTGRCNYSIQKKLSIGVHGAGFGGGQTKSGLEKAPNFIRNSGFQQFLADEVGHDVKDYGDVVFEECVTKQTIIEGCVPLNNVETVSNANLKIYQSTLTILQDGRLPLTLGGDHSIAIGTLNAVTEIYSDIGVLWVDAHADLNTPHTTKSGNLHGLPLAFHVKELQEKFKCLQQFKWVVPRIPAQNIAYIGLREIGGKFNPMAQRDIIRRLGIKTFTMSDVDRLGILEVTKRALDHVTLGGKRKIHLSFDVDVLDDLEVGKSTGTAVSGGLTLREGISLLEIMYEHIISADFVEINPALGDAEIQERTSNICKHLLGAMFGYTRAGL